MLKNDKAMQASEWLTNRIATIYKIPAENIDADKVLTEYGLDSMNAIALVGELEEMFEIELPSNLLWNYNTINKVAEYVGSQV